MTVTSHDRAFRSGQVMVTPIGGHGSGRGHASAALPVYALYRPLRREWGMKSAGEDVCSGFQGSYWGSA